MFLLQMILLTETFLFQLLVRVTNDHRQKDETVHSVPNTERDETFDEDTRQEAV